MPTISMGLPKGIIKAEIDSFEEQCIKTLLQTEELTLKREEIEVWPYIGEGKRFFILVLGLEVRPNIKKDVEQPFSIRRMVAGLLGAVIREKFPGTSFKVYVAPTGDDWACCSYSCPS